jgi:hypothetical protein
VDRGIEKRRGLSVFGDPHGGPRPAGIYALKSKPSGSQGDTKQPKVQHPNASEVHRLLDMSPGNKSLASLDHVGACP